MAKPETLSENIPAREKERVCVYMSEDMFTRLKKVIGYQHFKKGKSMDVSPYLLNELIVPHIERMEEKIFQDKL
jgi:hypothetical protein